MALLMNDASIIFYHMAALQLVGLPWSYFSHPEYLVFQWLVHAVVLFPDFITPQGCLFFFILSKSPLEWWFMWMGVHLVTTSRTS